MFLSQVLSADGSCREAVRRFLAWLGLAGHAPATPNTAAKAKARARLRERDLEDVNTRVRRAVEARAGAEDLWWGRRVKVVDGSALSMPDTPANQKVYPQSARARPGCGFPVMRLVVLFSLATGVILGLAKAGLRVAERTLFRRLWDLLEPGDVVLGDRGFSSYAEVYCLAQAGVDSVTRKNARRRVGLTALGRLGPGDHLVQWHKTGRAPAWLDPDAWRAMPDRLTVREIHFSVEIPGFRTHSITVVTTLLDPVAFPREAFADLYRRRWMAELYLRDIKITAHLDVLRCKSPAMIHKELLMHLIAYHLVRGLMLEAARRHSIPIHRISFKGTLTTVRTWAPVLAAARLAGLDRERLTDLLLSYIAQDPLPDRPNRVEPRARKRRPKNYQLLNRPRHLFKEIPHRTKYEKALS